MHWESLSTGWMWTYLHAATHLAGHMAILVRHNKGNAAVDNAYALWVCARTGNREQGAAGRKVVRASLLLPMLAHFLATNLSCRQRAVGQQPLAAATHPMAAWLLSSLLLCPAEHSHPQHSQRFVRLAQHSSFVAWFYEAARREHLRKDTAAQFIGLIKNLNHIGHVSSWSRRSR